jgi:hypothetical protein
MTKQTPLFSLICGLKSNRVDSRYPFSVPTGRLPLKVLPDLGPYFQNDGL